MDFPFYYLDDRLFIEAIAVEELAKRFGTPLFIYSKEQITDTITAILASISESKHRWNISYALKANSNPTILHIIASEGLGASVVSGGELLAALKAGFKGEDITFDGPGKTRAEIDLALRSYIKAIVAESEQELQLIQEEALRLGVRASVMLRVNPHIDAKTHPYISTGLLENKFGIDIEEAERLLLRFNFTAIELVGIHSHIGSQISELSPFSSTAEALSGLVKRLRSKGFVSIRYVNLGGGLAVNYYNCIEHPRLQPEAVGKTKIPAYKEYFNAISKAFESIDIELIAEPGRSIVTNSCALITEVLYTKSNPHRTFAIVDAAMTELIRPSLYHAYHQIVPLDLTKDRPSQITSVVGPVCETGDFLALDRSLPSTVQGEYLAVLCVGAYGYVLSSNYNMRPRAAEILVDGSNVSVIRERQKIEELLA